MSYVDGAKFSLGAEVRSEWHGEQGTVTRIEWSTTFGQRTYRLDRTRPARIAGAVGSQVWVCESDLHAVRA